MQATVQNKMTGFHLIYKNKKTAKMKKLIVLTLLLTCALYNKVTAQAYTNVNIVTQPLWGPTGYDHVEYYYFPDLDAYYYVPGAQYIYRVKKSWVTVTTMPLRFKNFDFYSAHKVVLNEPKPYMNDRGNKAQYAQYKKQHDQLAIRDSHEQKYLVKTDHPEHGKWISPQDIQDKQNRLDEQTRAIAQVKQDSLNRVDLQSKENMHNKQDSTSRSVEQSKEDLHNKQNQLNNQQLQNNEDSHKH